MDILEALHQRELMDGANNLLDSRFPSSPFFTEASVQHHQAYSKSRYKFSGSTPFFTLKV